MKRTALLVSLSLVVGIAFGVIGMQILNAQEPLKRTELMKTDLEGMEGKQAVFAIVEFAPGAVVGKHYHSGHEFAYILEGAFILETEGQPPVTFGPGQVLHNLPTRVHVAKNGSMTEPLKVVQLIISEKGQPWVTPVK